MPLLENFLKYVGIDTRSDRLSGTAPSTEKQYDLLRLLKSQLNNLGLESSLDDFGDLYCCIPGNPEWDALGICAHVDTAEEASGANVHPTVIHDYDGKDIELGSSGLVLSPVEFPKLNECLGRTLIVTDGTTLLGGDDKAGLAVVMEAVERLLKIEPYRRHPLFLLFTPDEEIGRGVDHVDLNRFRPAYCYTVDGGDPHVAAIENFNAYGAHVKVRGRAIHPGTAKGELVNASSVLIDFIARLPKDMVPEKTSGREGFHHLLSMSGEVEKAEADFIIRNHDRKLLEKQLKEFDDALRETREDYPKAEIELTTWEQYKNMLEIIMEHPAAKEHLEKAYEALGMPLRYEPIRGGTDGARLSYLGIPTPNIGTGSYNHHGPFEFAVLEEMEELVNVVAELALLE